VFHHKLVIKPVLNHGVLDVLLLVFHVFLVVVHTVPDKLLLVTCVVVVVCSLQPRPGENGKLRPTKTNRDTPLFLLLLLLVFHLSFSLVVTRSTMLKKFHLLLLMMLNPTLRLKKPFLF
jgi:hypothetical protein